MTYSQRSHPEFEPWAFGWQVEVCRCQKTRPCLNQWIPCLWTWFHPPSETSLGSSWWHISPSGPKHCLPLHLNLSHLLDLGAQTQPTLPSTESIPCVFTPLQLCLWHPLHLYHQALSFTPAKTPPRYHSRGKSSLNESHWVYVTGPFSMPPSPWGITFFECLWYATHCVKHSAQSSQCDSNSRSHILWPCHFITEETSTARCSRLSSRCWRWDTNTGSLAPSRIWITTIHCAQHHK